MSNYGPRKPLHFQNPGLAKSLRANPSYRVSRLHDMEYKDIEDRPGMSKDSIMRRYPDGSLDMEWAKNMVVDAIHNLSTPHALQPLQSALLKMVFPDAPLPMLDSQANLMTKLSSTEKDKLKTIVTRHLMEEANWNTGRGGGNLSPSRNGIP